MQVSFPRIVLAEWNTHRQFSRNSASSRAIPVEKMIERVESDPFIPKKFPKNQKGMQADDFLTGDEAESAKEAWLDALGKAVQSAKSLLRLNVHKQITNRLLEPFMWHTVVVTSTEWSNFFAQRCDKDAQPEIQTIAYMIQDLYNSGIPNQVSLGKWHTPYILSEEVGTLPDDYLTKISVARCARVSYLTQEGIRDIKKDLELFNRLTTGNHWSPFEHVATPDTDARCTSGNFRGWYQFRKQFPQECR